MTIGDALLRRGNGLTSVRLGLALVVIALHAGLVGGFDPGSAFYGAHPFGQWAVPGFFCLSGFLIAGSRTRLGLGRFLWHRAVRIFPAYWVCLIVVAFALAPLSTASRGSWSWSSALDYVTGNAFLVQVRTTIPGTLDGFVWNASLWTLVFEFAAYVLAGTLLTGATRTQGAVLAAALTGAAMLGNLWAVTSASDVHPLTSTALELGGYFSAGMLLYFLADRLPLRLSWSVTAVALLAGTAAVAMESVLAALPLAYLVLYLGAVVPARCSPRSDLSYGVYIYAFPVQVLVETFLPDLGVATHIAATVVLVMPLAWLSWHCVEGPALRLKSLRGRGGGNRALSTPVAAGR